MTKRRWLPRIIAATGITAGIVAALIWSQERSLDAVQQRLAAGDAAGALTAVDAYLARRPTDPRGIALRGRALVLAGEPAEAAFLFEQVGAAEIEDLRAWSTALLSLGQWERALPILGRMSQIDPGDGETLERIAICHFELGHRQAALDASHRLSELPGFEAIGNLQLASMYTEWESALNAVRYFKKVLQHRPDATGLPMTSGEFFQACADSLLAAGNARQALQILHRKKSGVEPTLEHTLRTGQAWQEIGDATHARACFEQVIHQQPDHREARQRLADIALQEGNAAGALELLAPLVAQNRVDANGAYLLLRAYTSLDDEAMMAAWQEKTTTLRKQRRRLNMLQAEAAEQPSSPRAMTITAYLAAADQDWKSAGRLLATLLRAMPEAYEVPFVQQLVDAVRQQGPLPPIESLPQLPGR